MKGLVFRPGNDGCDDDKLTVCVCVCLRGGCSAPSRRTSHFRDVNSALGRRQLPPPINPARLTLHGSPVIDNTICPLGSIPVTRNLWIRGTGGTRETARTREKQRSARSQRPNRKPSPPLHLTTRHQAGRKVWECHTIRFNAD